MRNETTQKIIRDMDGLKEQNTILKTIRDVTTGNLISMWHRVTENMPSNIFKFSRKALIFSLPINTNLKRWKKVDSDLCPLCNAKQTQLHVLNNCKIAVNEGRYTWRHDSILFTILHYVNQLNEFGFEVRVDLPGYRSTSELFNRFRPDIVLIKGNEVYSIELTCCFESNFIKSNRYKIERYANLENDLIEQKKLTKFFVEVSSLGFIPKHNDIFYKFLKTKNINTDRLKMKLSETALRCSYFLYTQRNKSWSQKEILKFY